jgi:GT2 family glycosyltransferase
MGSEEKVGVVTVTFNSAKVLPDFLRCIAQQSHKDFLLYAVDNASTDDSIEILRAFPDERLRIIANSENKGVAEGNNQGIQAALESGCRSVLLINNDTEFGPEVMAQLLQALDDNRVDMCCPKMLYFDEPNRIWAAGGEFQPWFGYRVIHLGEGEMDSGQYDQGRLVTYTPTCCVLIRKKVFDTIGLMDSRYFVYADDTDFMFRAMRRGLALWYFPECRLWHKVSSLTGGDSTPFAIRYMTRNRIYFYRKNFSRLAALLWILFYRSHLSFRYLRGIDSAAIWKAKRQAVHEGLAMATSSLN